MSIILLLFNLDIKDYNNVVESFPHRFGANVLPGVEDSGWIGGAEDPPRDSHS